MAPANKPKFERVPRSEFPIQPKTKEAAADPDASKKHPASAVMPDSGAGIADVSEAADAITRGLYGFEPVHQMRRELAILKLLEEIRSLLKSQNEIARIAAAGAHKS